MEMKLPYKERIDGMVQVQSVCVLGTSSNGINGVLCPYVFENVG